MRDTRVRGGALVLVVVVVVGACAETTFEAPETTSISATTSAVVADPLAALSTETAALSATLIDNDGQGEALARIETLWGEARPEIADERPDLVDGFDRVIQLIRRSVERRRPADADKAHKNLLVLIAAYEG